MAVFSRDEVLRIVREKQADYATREIEARAQGKHDQGRFFGAKALSMAVLYMDLTALQIDNETDEQHFDRTH